MHIRIGYDISFEVPVPAPTILSLYVHPERAGDLQLPELIEIEPRVPVREYIDAYGNRCGIVLAPAGTFRLHHENIVYDTGEPEAWPDAIGIAAPQLAVNHLPADCVQYLLASRYCEVDKCFDIAWKLFGQFTPGWARVRGICYWVHANVTFGYQHASPTKTAMDTYEQRTGVCRDFTHLAITFCRCLNIPARYATGYLGDIGVPPDPSPMDFAAFMEVYLGDRWWPVDVRHNMPRIGRVLMARGRDAVDVPLTTNFGQATLKKFVVVTQEIK
jgi:transglutaminase-like putative cysteine protease